MDNFYLAAILTEVTPSVVGRSVSRVSLSEDLLSFDFRLKEGRHLVISLVPANPGLFLAGVCIRPDGSGPQSAGYFISSLRKNLNGTRLVSLRKIVNYRAVELRFEAHDFAGVSRHNQLVLRLTGRGTNAYLLEETGNVLATYKERGGALPELESQPSTLELEGALQSCDSTMSESEAVDRFFGRDSAFGPLLREEFHFRCRSASPSDALKSLASDLSEGDPVPLVYSSLSLNEVGTRRAIHEPSLLLSCIELAQAAQLQRYEFESFSDAAEAYYIARWRAASFESELRGLRLSLERAQKKEQALLSALEGDLNRFGDPEQLKRWGDLLLANATTARSDGNTVRLPDYYDPSQPEIELEMLGAPNLQQAASRYFERYQKARRAVKAIGLRCETVKQRLQTLEALSSRLAKQPTASTVSQLKEEAQRLLGIRQSSSGSKRRQVTAVANTGRWFRSSEGYEIVVGRNDRENDAITFRLARPGDTWLHAADYPGSHVIVRNPGRAPLPQKTLHEAAAVTAYYSQAKEDGKVAVHYTLRKFVSKPPRAKPGLVRLSSLKTVVIAPACTLERIL